MPFFGEYETLGRGNRQQQPTKGGGYKFLSEGNFDEVNFWQPSGRAPFSNLPAGTPFLFKLKAPNNHIAGGGYFVNFSTLPLPMAWEAFGPKNGSASFKEFDQRIRGYATGTGSTLDIGCNVLVQPFFFERKDWIALPNWPKSV